MEPSNTTSPDVPDQHAASGPPQSKMTGQFTLFPHLPQEIQDQIWENCMVNPSPCVQALGVYRVPKTPFSGPEALDEPPGLEDDEATIEQFNRHVRKKLEFVVHDPALARRSPFHHAVAEAGQACRAASKILKKAQEQLSKDATAELLALKANPDIRREEIDKSRTMVVIHAKRTRLREKEKQSGCDPERLVGSVREVKHCDTVAVFLNPTLDILWLDFPFGISDPDAHRNVLGSGMNTAYSSELAAVQQLATEFAKSQFRKACRACDSLEVARKRYSKWLEATRQGKTTSVPRDEEVCLLCTALDDPWLDDLSAAQKQEVKEWLKLRTTRRLLTLYRRNFAALEIIKHSGPVEKQLMTGDGSFDVVGFLSNYSQLERVHHIMVRLKRDSKNSGSGSEMTTAACLDDFDGDQLAFYNNVVCEDAWGDGYWGFTESYYDASGLPICHAGQPHDGLYHHQRVWCENTRAQAHFWPLETPNLRTLYVIDRGITLKPGASLPAGAQTFQGNGCVYVEVPGPENRSLEKGGEDAVWQYPEARPWGATAFSLARHLRKLMFERQGELRTGTGRFLTSAQRWAVQSGKVPECRVLAIVE